MINTDYKPWRLTYYKTIISHPSLILNSQAETEGKLHTEDDLCLAGCQNVSS